MSCGSPPPKLERTETTTEVFHGPKECPRLPGKLDAGLMMRLGEVQKAGAWTTPLAVVLYFSSPPTTEQLARLTLRVVNLGSVTGDMAYATIRAGELPCVGEEPFVKWIANGAIRIHSGPARNLDD